MIDLHLHTTASDGHLTPAELVSQAALAGATVIAVTDHDTVGACTDVRTLAAALNITAITGIEITAVENGRDVHMLGYFVDTSAPRLIEFLAAQRQIRIDRVRRIGVRLAELGRPVDVTRVTASAKDARRTIGRPQIADAMIAAGHVADRRDAFENWLGAGKPAFVPRDGAAPELVIDIVHDAGGLISLAHPGRTLLPDDRVRQLAAAGLDAIEVYHSDHDAALVTHYAELADDLRLLRTGGSDFHGDPTYGVSIGGAALPFEHWERLRARAAR